MVLLYGRAGRLTSKNGGFRPGQATSTLEEAAFPDIHAPPPVQQQRDPAALRSADDQAAIDTAVGQAFESLGVKEGEALAGALRPPTERFMHPQVSRIYKLPNCRVLT